MNATVALTGATGFIGKHIAENLLAAGFTVRALTRSPEKSVDRKLAWVHGSLESPDALRELVRGADSVVHCAGRVRGQSQAAFMTSNVTGSTRLLEMAKENSCCKRFLFISSLAARHPQLSWYAHSKLVAEQRLMAEKGPLALGIFRPTAVYGPGDKELQPLFRWLLRGLLLRLGQPETQLSFLHVCDLAHAVIRWLQHHDAAAGPYELCDGLPGGYSWPRLREIGAAVRHGPVRLVGIPLPVLRLLAHLSQAVQRISRKEPMLTQSKIGELTHPDWSASNQLLSERIDWAPTIRLEQALRDELF